MDYDTYTLDVARAMRLKAAVPLWRSFLDTYPSRKAWPIFAQAFAAGAVRSRLAHFVCSVYYPGAQQKCKSVRWHHRRMITIRVDYD